MIHFVVAVITVNILHSAILVLWHFESAIMVLFHGIFLQSWVFFIPIVSAAVCVVSLSLIGEKRTLFRLKKLTILMYLLMSLSVVYIIHGVTFARDLFLTSSSLQVQSYINVALESSHSHSAKKNAAKNIFGFFNNAVIGPAQRAISEHYLPYPLWVWYFFANRSILAFLLWGFIPAALISVLTISVYSKKTILLEGYDTEGIEDEEVEAISSSSDESEDVKDGINKRRAKLRTRALTP